MTGITAADTRRPTMAAITAIPTPVVRYRRVIRPAYAYYGGPRFYGPRYYRRW